MVALVVLMLGVLVVIIYFSGTRATPAWTDTNEFIAAIRSGNLEEVRRMLDEGASRNDAYDDRTTALHVAVDEGHVDIVRELLKRGANVNARRLDDTTPLHYAARGIDRGTKRGAEWARNLQDWCMEDGNQHAKENAALIEAVLSARPEINAKDNTGTTAIHFAVLTNNLEAAKRLIEAGADLEAVTDDTKPLMLAVELEYLEMVELLVKSGADVDSFQENGHTNLMDAVWSGNVELVRLLVRLGADVRQKNDDGVDALEYAKDAEEKEMVAVLEGRFPSAKKETTAKERPWRS